MSINQDEEDVKDTGLATTSECLDCFEKHVGKAIVLMGEIQDRLFGRLPDHEEHIREDLGHAMRELAAAEDHVTLVKDATPEKTLELQAMKHQARVLRDSLRNFKKELAEKSKEEHMRVIGELIIKGEELGKRIDRAIKTFGCGQCQITSLQPSSPLVIDSIVFPTNTPLVLKEAEDKMREKENNSPILKVITVIGGLGLISGLGYLFVRSRNKKPKATTFGKNASKVIINVKR